jgi:hypothetical protein
MFKKGNKIYFKQNMIHWVTVALIICFLLPSVAISREPKDTIYPNAIKLNLAGAAFRNLSLYYERQINDRWSAHLGAGYKFGGGIPEFVGLGNFVIASESNGIRGFSVTPEARYHFRQCGCDTPTGLYLGAYFRATRYYGEVTFNFWDTSS